MRKKQIRRNNEGYPSLYDIFKPGERVYRMYRDDQGNTVEYEGIILSITDEIMDVYWDTVNGKYNPQGIQKNFTCCAAGEIFDGNAGYTPIKRKNMFFRGVIKPVMRNMG